MWFLMVGLFWSAAGGFGFSGGCLLRLFGQWFMGLQGFLRSMVKWVRVDVV